MTRSNENSPGRRSLDGLVHDPALRSAIACWDALRDGRLVPPRLLLDPVALRPVLQQCAILENPRPGSVRIRLAGARISAFMGMEARGLPLRALFDLADRGRITAEAERALAEPGVLLLGAVSPAPRHGLPDAPVLRAQIAILPMSDVEGAVTRALLVMGDTASGSTRPPEAQRWSVAQVDRVALKAGVPVLTSEARPHIVHAVVHADEEASETKGALARARFRVIEGGLA
jgi:hypothetical protein